MNRTSWRYPEKNTENILQNKCHWRSKYIISYSTNSQIITANVMILIQTNCVSVRVWHIHSSHVSNFTNLDKSHWSFYPPNPVQCFSCHGNLLRLTLITYELRSIVWMRPKLVFPTFTRSNIQDNYAIIIALSCDEEKSVTTSTRSQIQYERAGQRKRNEKENRNKDKYSFYSVRLYAFLQTQSMASYRPSDCQTTDSHNNIRNGSV